MRKQMLGENEIDKKSRLKMKEHEDILKAEKYLDRNEFESARKIYSSILKKSPKSHWLLTRIGTTFYEERNYKKALKYSERALKLSPKCPLVLWDYASSLDMLGREMEAIKIWKSIIRRGIDSIAYDECGEGLVWARSLVNDSIYRIGLAYLHLGRKN